jgi:hypothetical protein
MAEEVPYSFHEKTHMTFFSCEASKYSLFEVNPRQNTEHHS